MGTKWRMALVATITIALCTLAVMVVDGEDATHLVEAVKMRAHTAIRRSASWMNGAMKRTPTLAEVSKLTPHDQQRLLSELKSRKQSLKKVLRTNAQRAKYSHETWDAADASDTGAGKDVVLTGTNMVEGVQQRQEYVNDRALEQTAASILVDVRRQESYDLRRRQQVESDEDELEEEQTTAFQQKMEEKDRKNKQKIKQLEEKLRDLQGKKDATNKNTAAKVESKQEAVSTVTTPDVEIQEDALQLPSNQQNQQLPSNAAEQQQVDNNRVAELTAQIAQLKQRRKTPLNPSENSEQPTEKFQEEPAIVDIETSVKAEDVSLPKKKTKQARAVPAPESSTVADEVEKSNQKAQHNEAQEMLREAEDEVEQDQRDAAKVVPETESDPEAQKFEDEPMGEPMPGEEEETATEAEYGIMYYAVWGSLGAFVIGILGTVIYCAIQAPRDRPWGMPPKRNY